jgi:uncharacterized membrane protein YdjX (TVP38/TMEM64 family)
MGNRVKVAALAASALVLFGLSRVLPLAEWFTGAVGWIQSIGWLGLGVMGALYVVATVLMVPGSLLTLGTGFIAAALLPESPFRAVLAGTGVVIVSSTAGATAAFALGRGLAREWVAGRVAERPRFKALDQAIGDHDLKMVLLLRLSPVFPFNLLNYALGLTQVGTLNYVVATFFGMLPGAALYVYLGTGVKEVGAALSGAAEAGPLKQAFLAAGLAVTAGLVVWATLVARRALRQAMEEQGRHPQEDA